MDIVAYCFELPLQHYLFLEGRIVQSLLLFLQLYLLLHQLTSIFLGLGKTPV